MSMLLKDNPKVPFAGREIEIKELTIIKLKEAKSNITKIVHNFFKELEKLEKLNTDDTQVINVVDQLLDTALEMPYEVCKIFIPEITPEQVDNATPREIINLINEALEVNGFFMMKEKLGKMFQMMR